MSPLGLSPLLAKGRRNFGSGSLNLPQPLFTERGELFLLVLMSVINFIEKLQGKPRYVRIQIMWAGVILSSLIIVIFWFWSLRLSLEASSNAPVLSDENLQKLNEMKKEVPGLWQSLGAGIGNIIDMAKTDINSNSAATPSVSPVESQADQLPIEQ